MINQWIKQILLITQSFTHLLKMEALVTDDVSVMEEFSELEDLFSPRLLKMAEVLSRQKREVAKEKKTKKNLKSDRVLGGNEIAIDVKSEWQ